MEKRRGGEGNRMEKTGPIWAWNSRENRFPREQDTPPLLFHTPVFVAKPGASLQRLLEEAHAHFIK